jgi:methylmalonyl-CoA mutase N-terminal domain/subunit
MKEVQEAGGIVQAIAQGRVQNTISKQAYENQRALERGESRKVGVNCYQIEEEEPSVEFHAFKEEDCRKQIERLDRIRAERDGKTVDRELARVLEDAKAGRNVMPAVITAVKAYATVGEITDRLLEAFGRYQEPVQFK